MSNKEKKFTVVDGVITIRDGDERHVLELDRAVGILNSLDELSDMYIIMCYKLFKAQEEGNSAYVKECLKALKELTNHLTKED